MKKSPKKVNADIIHDTQKAELDPWLVWVTFRRTWIWALPVGALLACLAAMFLINSFVPKYQATHLLVANEDYVVFKGVMPVVKDLAKSEKTLFYNPIVLDPVLNEPENRLAPSLSNPATAEANLLRNLAVGSGGTESTLKVSYTDSNPAAAAMICNAVVNSYLSQRDAFDNKRVSNLEVWIAPEIKRWELEVGDRKRKVESLSKQTLGSQVTIMENASNTSNLAGLRKELGDLEYLIAMDEAKEKQVATDEAKRLAAQASVRPLATPDVSVKRIAPTRLLIESMVPKNDDVIEAENRITHYKSEIMGIEDDPDRFGTRRDEYKYNRTKLAEWQAYLPQAEAAARIEAKAELDELAELDFQARREEAIAEAKSQQEAMVQEQVERETQWINKLAEEQAARDDRKKQLALLKKYYIEEKSRLEDFGSATADMQFAQDDYEIANDVLGKLRGRLAAIRTERRQDGAVRSFAPATTPRIPIEPVPYKMLVVVSLGAMLVPFMLGFLWEFRTQRVTDSAMCSKKGLAVIGEIAQLPSDKRSSKGRRIFEESIDTLRTSLFLSVDTRDTRSIAVVSSMSGEGKSSVASQLALSIAKATGETVLLVDADLRCPDQHDIFGLEIGPGLSGVLAGTATQAEAIDKSLGNRIHVLPAGPLMGSPHRLLSVEKMQAFVDEALKEYRYVVLDTAPVLSAGESLAVASVVDATLLCVMRDLSRMENVTRTTRRLEAVGATLAGTVFSGVTARQYAYRYGDYQYSSSQANITSVS